MAKYLAFDTSTRAASVAIVEDNNLLGEFYTNYQLKHSEKLLFLIEDLLKSTGSSLNEMECFIVGNGPGSFTGLRISSASVKSFAHALNKKIIPVSSLMASAYPLTYFNGVICPIFDAQKNLVYANTYCVSNNNLITNKEDEVLEIEQLIKTAKNENKDIIFSGDALFKHKEFIKEALGDKAYFPLEKDMLPKASSLIYLYLNQKELFPSLSYEEYLPNYIRKFNVKS